MPRKKKPTSLPTTNVRNTRSISKRNVSLSTAQEVPVGPWTPDSQEVVVQPQVEQLSALQIAELNAVAVISNWWVVQQVRVKAAIVLQRLWRGYRKFIFVKSVLSLRYLYSSGQPDDLLYELFGPQRVKQLRFSAREFKLTQFQAQCRRFLYKKPSKVVQLKLPTFQESPPIRNQIKIKYGAKQEQLQASLKAIRIQKQQLMEKIQSQKTPSKLSMRTRKKPETPVKDASLLLQGNINLLTEAELESLTVAHTLLNKKYTKPLKVKEVVKIGPRPESPDAKTLRMFADQAKKENNTPLPNRTIKWKQEDEHFYRDYVTTKPIYITSQPQSCIKQNQFQSDVQVTASPVNIQRFVYKELISKPVLKSSTPFKPMRKRK